MFIFLFHGCLYPFDLGYIYRPFSPSLVILSQLTKLHNKSKRNQKKKKTLRIRKISGAETVTATPAAELVPASPSESAAPVCTEPTLVAEQLLRRPDRLERLCRKHFKSLEGPKRLELVVEMSERAQDRGEIAAFSANVLKKDVQGQIQHQLSIDLNQIFEAWFCSLDVGCWLLVDVFRLRSVTLW